MSPTIRLSPFSLYSQKYLKNNSLMNLQLPNKISNYYFSPAQLLEEKYTNTASYDFIQTVHGVQGERLTVTGMFSELI